MTSSTSQLASADDCRERRLDCPPRDRHLLAADAQRDADGWAGRRLSGRQDQAARPTRFSPITRGQALASWTMIDISNGRGMALTDGRQRKLRSPARDLCADVVELVQIGRVVELQQRGDLRHAAGPYAA